jgi:hypothetical protein
MGFTDVMRKIRREVTRKMRNVLAQITGLTASDQRASKRPGGPLKLPSISPGGSGLFPGNVLAIQKRVSYVAK